MNNFKVDILAFGAHPDDVECAAAGVLLKHISLGKKVAIIDMTQGEMGTYGTKEIRHQETLKASEILGISFREQLYMSDGGLENTEENKLKVIRMIRKYQPEIILSNAVEDRHPDHAMAAKIVNDASFVSGLIKKETTYNDVLQEPWRPKVVYNYIQDYFIPPNFVIDISKEMGTKMEVIKAFSSQFVTPKTNEPSGIMGLLDQIKSTNSILGRQINAKYAEGFTVNRYIGVQNFFNLY